jgi:hypothetical protein
MTLKLPYIKNHVAGDVETIANPWDLALPGYSKSKTKFRQWCKDAETNHCFISGLVGLNPHQRVRRKENPAVRQLAIIVDLDCPPVSELHFPDGREPRWIARTFSGGYRLLYALETPVNFGQLPGLVDKWLDVLITKLGLKKLPGFDEKAFRDVGLYYEVGREWVEFEDKLIETATLEAWLAEASRRYDWKTSGDVVVPIEIVRAELSAKYPNAWPGGWESFDIGARGSRFWDDDGDALSVVVRETGLSAFTHNRGFLPWSAPELLGSAFVAKYYETSLSAATEGIYHDGKYYWRERQGGWASITKSDIVDDLEVMGLNPTRNDGEPSEVMRAAALVRANRRVAGVVPLFYRPPGVIEVDGERLINTTRARPVAPAETCAGWGDGFPWLRAFFEQWLDEDPLNYFLAHLKHAYAAAHLQRPTRGLAVVIAGAVNSGKTFANNAIMGQLLGGCQDASSYLIDGDPYNAELFAKPVWTLDDVADGGTFRENSRFSKMLKRTAANDKLTCRAMYREAVKATWLGRIYMTCNDDAESLRALPRTDINILDKLLILRAKSVNVSFPTDEGVMKELPYFARFLLDWEPPKETQGSARFGVEPWQDPALIEVTQELDPHTVGNEIIEQWRSELTEPWEGYAHTLFDAIVESGGSAAGRTFSNVRALGWHLRRLIESGETGILKKRDKKGVKYQIAPSSVVSPEVVQSPF